MFECTKFDFLFGLRPRFPWRSLQRSPRSFNWNINHFLKFWPFDECLNNKCFFKICTVHVCDKGPPKYLSLWPLKALISGPDHDLFPLVLGSMQVRIWGEFTGPPFHWLCVTLPSNCQNTPYFYVHWTAREARISFDCSSFYISRV